MITAATPHPTRSSAASRPRTHSLLTAAALAGPLFYASSVVQTMTRPGFDIRVHPLSQLATGGPGWIQMLSFSALAIACVALLVRSIRQRRVWASLGHGLVALVLLPMSPTESSIQIAVTGPIAFTWVTVSALHLRSDLEHT